MWWSLSPGRRWAVAAGGAGYGVQAPGRGSLEVLLEVLTGW